MRGGGGGGPREMGTGRASVDKERKARNPNSAWPKGVSTIGMPRHGSGTTDIESGTTRAKNEMRAACSQRNKQWRHALGSLTISMSWGSMSMGRSFMLDLRHSPNHSTYTHAHTHDEPEAAGAHECPCTIQGVQLRGHRGLASA
jgi:hypothetical protein